MAYPYSVTVNLEVLVSATGKIDVFGDTTVAPANKIVALCNLPVNALYSSASAGMFEFWEPSSHLTNIYAKLASTVDFNVGTGESAVASYQASAKNLASGLQRLLVDSFNVTNASPFNGTKYDGTNATAYRTQRDFGRLALGCYAHYLFGHQAATTAITNDAAFIRSMLSLGTSTNVEDNSTAVIRNTAWSHLADVSNNLIESWGGDMTATDANLAVGLTKALISKGISGTNVLTSARMEVLAGVTGIASSTATIANIVKQVLGQDPSRAMGQDNNALAPDIHQILRFEAGDKIIVNIKLATPTVLINNETRTTNANPATTAYAAEENYSLEITLGAVA